MVVRTFDEECSFVKQLDDCSYAIEKGFVPNMRVPGHFYVNDVRDWHLQSKTCEKILFPSWSVQGYLAHKKQRPPRTLK